MKLKHTVAVLAATAALGALAPSAMAAARFTSQSTAAGQNVEGLNSSNGASLGQHVFQINSSYSWRCNSVSVRGTTPTLPTASITLQPTYRNCALISSGTAYPVTVACQTWTLSGPAATYNPATFATTGLRITLNGVCTISLTGTGCTITLSAQTVSRGIAAQNRNATDTANAASGGSRLALSSAGPFSGTSSAGCASLGYPASFSAFTYTGMLQFTPHASAGVNFVGLWETF